MSILLDTHALLWWLFDSPQLSNTVRKLLADPNRTVFVSAASAWEITTKHRLGKLPEAGDVPDRFETYIQRTGFTSLPITTTHAALAGRLAIPHKDPFDRLLIAQAQLENLRLASIDRQIQAHAETVW